MNTPRQHLFRSKRTPTGVRYRCKFTALMLIISLLPLTTAWPQAFNVVASFSVLADMVREVGGDQLRVRALVGANGDPHVYEPTPSDSAALVHAQLVVINGLGLEGWMDRLITASGYKGPVIIASQGITTINAKAGAQFTTDPHAWTSVAKALIYAKNIQQALINADPSHATHYQISGERYLAALNDLDSWVNRKLAAIPLAQRKIITSHASFGYLGADYGIEFHAPQGFSTASDPSAQQIAGLIEQIRHNKINAVFIENATDGRLMQQVSRETRAKLGGILYAEALSQANGPAASYIKMIRYNIQTMVDAMLNN